MILTNISLDRQKLTLLEAQLMEGEIQRPETANSPVTETSGRNVVLPHTAVVKSPLSLPLLLNGVLGHALFVGLPIALAARRITNQSSFSTQAA